MRLTFLQQMEQTANVLGDQGTSSIPALRKTFSEDDELRDFDPAKALEMLHILKIVSYTRVKAPRGTARGYYIAHSDMALDFSIFGFTKPQPMPENEEENATRIQWANDLRAIADWLDTNCIKEDSDESA